MPTLALALLPAVLTAQTTAKSLTKPQDRAGIRIWIYGLLKGLETLLRQIGGMLGAMILIELVFAWPGLGRLASATIARQDLPVLLGVFRAYIKVILGTRLLAELFAWLARLFFAPVPVPQVDPTRWRQAARTTWTVFGLVALVIPLALTAIGLTVSRHEALAIDISGTMRPPSPEHPLGTDLVGRDLLARILRGNANTLITTLVVATVTVLLALPVSVLSGWLASYKTWWGELLADLLFLPADAFLLVPTLLLATVLSTLGVRWVDQPTTSAIWLIAVTSAALLPRITRAGRALWIAAPKRRRGSVLGLAGPGALVAIALFSGYQTIIGMGYQGLGLRQPSPSVGGLLSEGLALLRTNPAATSALLALMWVCSFAFYLAADALTGFFASKKPLACANE
jgi:peptide/nickel transport system permease protein